MLHEHYLLLEYALSDLKSSLFFRKTGKENSREYYTIGDEPVEFNSTAMVRSVTFRGRNAEKERRKLIILHRSAMEMIAQVGGNGKWRGRVWRKLSTILRRKSGDFGPKYQRKGGLISA